MEIEVIHPKVTSYNKKSGYDILKSIETYGRVCYKSEDKITEGSAEKFVRNIIKRNHLAVIEHESLTVKVVCDRGVTHELVRHRLMSFCQESTRYVNYLGKPMQFIIPCYWQNLDKGGLAYVQWISAMKFCADTYEKLITGGATPQEARSVLPNSLKTELVITCNLREWRHFFKLRCDIAAHPQMRQVALMILEIITNNVPIIFDDYKERYLNV